MSLPEKSVFARSNPSAAIVEGGCTHLFHAVKFHRIIAYHRCCGSYENVGEQCHVETAAVIN